MFRVPEHLNQKFNTKGPSESKLLAFEQPGRWPLDVKIFELEFFDPTHGGRALKVQKKFGTNIELVHVNVELVPN